MPDSRISERPIGFTLVEILVVISIIGILSAIAVPVVGTALRTAKESAIRLEIDVMDQAMEAYKLKYGEYPPDFSSWKAVERHFRKAFPNIDDGELRLLAQFTHLDSDYDRVPISGSGATANVDPRSAAGFSHYRQCIDAAEAIVFCLGGYSSDARRPFTGTGGPLAPITVPGGAITADYGLVQYNTERDNAFFDFEMERLTFVVANDPTATTSPNPCSATSPYTYSSDEFVSTVTGTSAEDAFSTREANADPIKYLVDPFPVYSVNDELNPLAYFNARTYSDTFVPASVTGGWLASGNGWHALNIYLPPEGDTELGVARPYVSGQINTNAGGFMWVEAERFQIVSAGLDESFGGQVAAGIATAGAPAAAGVVYQFPSGSAVDFGASVVGNKYENTLYGAEKPQLDNITNFSTRTLESDLP
ncbi:MAG: type II secretion system protein [Planctomycetota bacterium]